MPSAHVLTCLGACFLVRGWLMVCVQVLSRTRVEVAFGGEIVPIAMLFLIVSELEKESIHVDYSMSKLL
jgi:hypothetical protein